ncbi:hypothetical protein B0H12DRAFT_1245171 [Mycena haematopus]|nr:hypothetical protein B0H12DRAFT_1245171 [Mycena haematopus]
MDVHRQKKKQTRSLLPRIQPATPAAQSTRARPRSRPIAESVPAVPPPWTPDTEATWQMTTTELSTAIEDWLAGTLPEGHEDDLQDADTGKTDHEQEQARERQRAWDRLIEQALDLMPEPRRRQWLAEQRLEEEWRSRSTPKAHDLDAFSDWSGSREYVD